MCPDTEHAYIAASAAQSTRPEDRGNVLRHALVLYCQKCGNYFQISTVDDPAKGSNIVKVEAKA
jgi:hypothetical protein